MIRWFEPRCEFIMQELEICLNCELYYPETQTCLMIVCDEAIVDEEKKTI